MNLRIVAAAGLCCSMAWADFSYEQSSKITGGAMAGMMRVAGAFSKAAREPQKMTIMVKGDRMATVMPNRVSIIDLNSETFTDVDFEKKTYATVTFAQMTEAMRKMAEKMGQKNNEGSVNFKADVKNTGQTRVIQGMNTKETIVTLTMEATDNKSNQKGEMNFVMDMWMAPDVPGYGEVRAFYQRMAQKMAWQPGGGMMGPMMAQYGKGMSELAKEMSKLEGIPVLQITRIGGAGGGQGMPSEAELAQAEQAQQQQQQQPQPNVQEAAGSAAAGAAGSRLGGRLGGLAGGLGGFGRRKKTEQQQEQAQQAPPPPQQQPQQQRSSAPGALMEMTTELTGFSSTADASKFEVPAGFKQVEHEMAKALR